MTLDEAILARDLLLAAPWPSSGTVDITILPTTPGHIVRVAFQVSQIVDYYDFRRPVTWEGIERALTWAGCLVGGSGSKPPVAEIVPDDDEPEPMPSWLRKTLLRIEIAGVTLAGSPLAKELMIAVERDTLPPPKVTAHDSGVLLEWKDGPRELVIHCISADRFTVWYDSPMQSLYFQTYTVGRTVQSRNAAWCGVRTVVGWMFGFGPLGREGMIW